MSFVDTSKSYLRHRDGRILPYGAMEVLEDGWSIIHPVTMIDGVPVANNSNDARAAAQAVEDAWSAMVDDLSSAWKSPTPHAPLQAHQEHSDGKRQTQAETADAAHAAYVHHLENAWRQP